MAFAVTGKCFPAPNRCDNCCRKMCHLNTKSSETKDKSESSSGTDEKGNGENSKCKADDKPNTKLKNAHVKETGNTEFKSKGERFSRQEIGKEKCQVDDKLRKEDNKTKSIKDDSKDTSKFRSKSENSIGKDEKGNAKGDKCKIDDDKKEKIDSKTKPEIDKEKSADRKVLKRCTGCFLMTYCDQTCQKEHWMRVHKYHCAYLSGKKVSSEHQEHSCEDCVANETASKDELFDIKSPKIGCRNKEESKPLRLALGELFRFHEDGHSCNCGIQFACEHPFPMGKMQGSAVATGLDEMIVHAAKLCNAFIIKSMKANEKKDIIDRLLVLHRSLLRFRAELWFQTLVYGEFKVANKISGLLFDSARDVRDKVDIENPWWKSLDFSFECILKMAKSVGCIQLAESEITDTKLIGKFNYHQTNIKNVSMITKNNLWHRFKLRPSMINNSLVLSLPKDVFCISCNADLSGQVVGLIDAWKSSNPSPSLFGEVAKIGGVVATCSPFRNFDCGKGFCIQMNALKLTEEEKQELRTIAENTRICHMCLKMSSSSHRCTECWAAQYCSKDCQLEDWNDFHQTVCSTWAEDPARRLMSSKKQKEVTKENIVVYGNNAP